MHPTVRTIPGQPGPSSNNKPSTSISSTIQSQSPTQSAQERAPDSSAPSNDKNQSPSSAPIPPELPSPRPAPSYVGVTLSPAYLQTFSNQIPLNDEALRKRFLEEVRDRVTVDMSDGYGTRDRGGLKILISVMEEQVRGRADYSITALFVLTPIPSIRFAPRLLIFPSSFPRRRRKKRRRKTERRTRERKGRTRTKS